MSKTRTDRRKRRASAILPDAALSTGPPFAIRARVLTPLASGGSRWEPDGLLEIDSSGRLASVGPAFGRRATATAVDLRPLLVLPGLVDLHTHLPQLPSAGLGAGLDLLTWLDRYIFPLEREWSDVDVAERRAPVAFRAFAAAGTTTALIHGTVFAASLDAAFRAAEAHGMRAVMGKVMMDRVTYDERIDPARILDRSMQESIDLCRRWNGIDAGRLRYAFTPRFAVSCTEAMLHESAAAARSLGAYWQSHLSEDRAEVKEVAQLFPQARDYLDVYDRAEALGERTILAHAVHLSDREVARLVESKTRVAHCPASNLFLASGVMPLRHYVDAGLSVGLGSDVAGGPDLSIFTAMRVGFYSQNALRTAAGDKRAPFGPLEWLRLGTLEGARALSIEGAIGSLEVGKEADFIVIDPSLTAPVPGLDSDDPAELMSRLIFRAHPAMVRAAFVRGRRLEGPGLAI